MASQQVSGFFLSVFAFLAPVLQKRVCTTMPSIVHLFFEKGFHTCLSGRNFSNSVHSLASKPEIWFCSSGFEKLSVLSGPFFIHTSKTQTLSQ